MLGVNVHTLARAKPHQAQPEACQLSRVPTLCASLSHVDFKETQELNLPMGND